MDDLQRQQFHEALLDADSFEDLSGSGRRRFWRQSSAEVEFREVAQQVGAADVVVDAFHAPPTVRAALRTDGWWWEVAEAIRRGEFASERPLEGRRLLRA